MRYDSYFIHTHCDFIILSCEKQLDFSFFLHKLYQDVERIFVRKP